MWSQILTAVPMKISAFWDTPCTMMKVNWRFEITYSFHFQGRRERKKSPWNCAHYLLLLVSLLAPWRGKLCFIKRQFTYTRLHGSISQKTQSSRQNIFFSLRFINNYFNSGNINEELNAEQYSLPRALNMTTVCYAFLGYLMVFSISRR
jgi:hypothetical protein